MTFWSRIVRSRCKRYILSCGRHELTRTPPSISTLMLCHNKFSSISHIPSASFMQRRSYSSDNIEINLVNRKGEKILVKAAPEDTLLDVVIDNEIDIESFGVCEGTLGCSTCHVILEKPIFELVDKVCPPTAEEYDMLDMACGLTETSRLGCQIEISKDLEGCTITIPREVSDARDI